MYVTVASLTDLAKRLDIQLLPGLYNHMMDSFSASAQIAVAIVELCNQFTNAVYHCWVLCRRQRFQSVFHPSVLSGNSVSNFTDAL